MKRPMISRASDNYANIPYADGHVDSQPILDNGGRAGTGNAGTAGNMPSGYAAGDNGTGGGGLGGVFLAKDFPL
jgi:hypothetical protein